MPYFLIISAALAAEYAGYTSGPNAFRSVKTSDGRTVCAYTSLLDFPDIFVGRRVTVVELELGDFPTLPPPAGLAAGGRVA